MPRDASVGSQATEQHGPTLGRRVRRLRIVRFFGRRGGGIVEIVVRIGLRLRRRLGAGPAFSLAHSRRIRRCALGFRRLRGFGPSARGRLGRANEKLTRLGIEQKLAIADGDGLEGPIRTLDVDSRVVSSVARAVRLRRRRYGRRSILRRLRRLRRSHRLLDAEDHLGSLRVDDFESRESRGAKKRGVRDFPVVVRGGSVRTREHASPFRARRARREPREHLREFGRLQRATTVEVARLEHRPRVDVVSRRVFAKRRHRRRVFACRRRVRRRRRRIAFGVATFLDGVQELAEGHRSVSVHVERGGEVPDVGGGGLGIARLANRETSSRLRKPSSSKSYSSNNAFARDRRFARNASNARKTSRVPSREPASGTTTSSPSSSTCNTPARVGHSPSSHASYADPSTRSTRKRTPSGFSNNSSSHEGGVGVGVVEGSGDSPPAPVPRTRLAGGGVGEGAAPRERGRGVSEDDAARREGGGFVDGFVVGFVVGFVDGFELDVVFGPATVEGCDFDPLPAVADGFAVNLEDDFDASGFPSSSFVVFAVSCGFLEALRLAATGGRVDLGAEDDDAAAPPSRSRLGGAGTGEEGSPNASKSRLASETSSSSPRCW